MSGSTNKLGSTNLFTQSPALAPKNQPVPTKEDMATSKVALAQQLTGKGDVPAQHAPPSPSLSRRDTSHNPKLPEADATDSIADEILKPETDSHPVLNEEDNLPNSNTEEVDYTVDEDYTLSKNDVNFEKSEDVESIIKNLKSIAKNPHEIDRIRLLFKENKVVEYKNIKVAYDPETKEKFLSNNEILTDEFFSKIYEEKGIDLREYTTHLVDHFIWNTLTNILLPKSNQNMPAMSIKPDTEEKTKQESTNYNFKVNKNITNRTEVQENNPKQKSINKNKSTDNLEEELLAQKRDQIRHNAEIQDKLSLDKKTMVLEKEITKEELKKQNEIYEIDKGG